MKPNDAKNAIATDPHGGEPQVLGAGGRRHRLRTPALDHDEHGKDHGRDHESRHHPRCRPAAVRRFDDREHEHPSPTVEQREPDLVQAGCRDRATSGRSVSQPARRARSEPSRGIRYHQNCSSSRPPVIGPERDREPGRRARCRWRYARARTDQVKTLVMIDKVEGKTIAAPMPITARAAISWVEELAIDPRMLATPKTVSPVINGP